MAVTVPPRHDQTEEPSAFHIEQHGIDHIRESERWGRPSSLFWMWAGAVWNMEFVVYGALMVVVFGLSFAQAVLIGLVGNLFYVLTGLCSIQGPVAGTTAFGVSRAAFGPNGNRLPSLFNWITQVGFEIEGIALIVFAGVALGEKAGYHPGTPFKTVLIVAAVVIQAILPFLGHATVLKVLKMLTIPFIALFAAMAVLTYSKVHVHAVHHGAGWGSMLVALALVIATGGLGWTENANDYSRYLPRDTDPRRIVIAVGLGAGVPSFLMEVLGAAIATGVPAATSITGMLGAFTAWFTWPFLIFAIAQLFANNTLDLYSSGVTLQSLGLRLARVHCVLLDAVVAGGFTAYAVFSNRFYQLLSDFLLFIIVWLAPWCAIYLVDCLLRRNRYDVAALMDTRGGLYYRSGGIHWPAIIAQVVGMVAAFSWLDAYSPYVSWLSSHFDGSDFSVFMGLFFGGLVYWLLAARGVKREVPVS
ncbi:MAG: purine-cytosine permease family protein [Acidimicrobiales bacterium]